MISIHQSQFLPWAPYFFKILSSDRFIILDNVQYEKNGVQNRNLIKTPTGLQWLTVPVAYSFGTNINEVKVSSQKCYRDFIRTLELNYKKGKFFTEIFDPIADIFGYGYSDLNELNIRLLTLILEITGIRTKIEFSSNFQIRGKKTDLIINLIKNFGENEYLTGRGALKYMQLDKFKKAGITVYALNFKHAFYPQLWTDRVYFIPELSTIDLLFNISGSDAREYIRKNGKIERVI